MEEPTKKPATQGGTSPKKRRGRGRPVEHRLGENLAVLLSLTREGSVTSAKDISHLLGITDERADEVLTILTSGLSEQDSMPLISLNPFGHDGESSRINGDETLKRLRLTQSQARACSMALDQLGFASDDPLRLSLEKTVFPKDYSPAETTATNPLPEEQRDTLYTCALSIARGKRVFTNDSDENDGKTVDQPPITFEYRGKNDVLVSGKRRRRTFVPLRLRLTGDKWLVDGYDCDISSSRSFELEGMVEVKLLDTTKTAPITDTEDPDYGFVKVSCNPKVRSKVLALNGAKAEGMDGARAIVKIPYYRGDWLARQLLALGKDVRFTSVPDMPADGGRPEREEDPTYSANNAELLKTMRQVAREDLKEYKKHAR